MREKRQKREKSKGAGRSGKKRKEKREKKKKKTTKYKKKKNRRRNGNRPGESGGELRYKIRAVWELPYHTALVGGKRRRKGKGSLASADGGSQSPRREHG